MKPTTTLFSWLYRMIIHVNQNMIYEEFHTPEEYFHFTLYQRSSFYHSYSLTKRKVITKVLISIQVEVIQYSLYIWSYNNY